MGSVRLVKWQKIVLSAPERFIRRRPLGFALIVCLALLFLVSLSPVKRQQEALAPQEDRARVFFGGAQSVGQSFVPLPGLHEISLRVGHAREPGGPLILHLRNEYFGADIRSVVNFELAANTENVVFAFERLPEAQKPLIWILEAPHAALNSYWIYREQDASAYPEGTAFFSGKPLSGNFAFIQTGARPAYLEWRPYLGTVVQPWEWQSILIFLIAGILWIIFGPPRKFSFSYMGWLGILIGASLLFHVFLAQRLPAIIDEGAYVQDGLQTTFHFWPLRDFLTKGPAYVLLLKIWRGVVPETLASWRLLSAVAWAGTLGLTALLGQRLGLSKKAQLIAAGLLALLPGIVAVSTPLLLQVVSTLFAILAVFLLLKGAQESRLGLITLGGVIMTVGYLTRSSTVVAGLVGGIVVLLYSPRRFRATGLYVLAGVLSLATVVIFSLLTMGVARTAVLLNLEAVVVGQIQAEMSGGIEPVIRWVTQACLALWRGGGVLLSGLVALPLLATRKFSRRWRLLLAGIWGSVLAGVVYHLVDIAYALPGEFLFTRVTMLLVVFGVPAIVFALSLRDSNTQSAAPQLPWRSAVVCLSWLTALTLLYRGWGIFRTTYIVEFLPAMALLAAVGLEEIVSWAVRSRLWQALAVGLCLATFWQGVSLALLRPVSGTMTLEAVEAGGALIAREVPVGEEIFTAQPMLTAAAARPIFRGYSHPGWIRAARVGGLPEDLRKIYFADDDEITRALADEVKYVVTDQRTNEIYFNDFPERKKILDNQFELVGEVRNDLTEEPFRLYRRSN